MSQRHRGRNRPRRVPDWREFEELVARIEEVAAPRGAIVTSPDRLPDQRTGRLREVDVSIRSKVGTATVLITVECRKRRHRQDVTWIEQLANRRHALGAAVTVAVSHVGFSEAAKVVAAHEGIQLRQLHTVDRADIESWVFPREFVLQDRRTKVRALTVRLTPQSRDEKIIEARDEDLLGLKQDLLGFPIFFRRHTGQKVTVGEIWHVAVVKGNLFDTVTYDGSASAHRVRIELGRLDIQMETAAGTRAVRAMVVESELWQTAKRLPIEEAQLYSYADLSGTTVRRAEFTTQAGDVPVRLAFQSVEGSPEIRVSLSALKP